SCAAEKEGKGFLNFGELFFQQLLAVEVGVVAVDGQQFVMSAELDDAAAVKDGDAIGIANSRNPVGNEDGGASLHYVTEMIQDFVFGLRVHAGERIVEN